MSTAVATAVEHRAGRSGSAEPVIVADFGSTFTKVTVVCRRTGRLLATARSRTTVDTDVMAGFDTAVEALGPGVEGLDDAPSLACSSAGGGLRVGVIGLERDLTAEAARTAALGAGAKVETVLTGPRAPVHELADRPPDIVLLTGGTDGGDGDALLRSAKALARLGLDVPVVVAGNREAQEEAVQILRTAGLAVTAAPNVMPQVGKLECEGVRAALRDVFLEHVIAGKGLSRDRRFTAMVRMATPDAVLAATSLLGALTEPATDLVVVDVGGATTDVHSVVASAAGIGRSRALLPEVAAKRTVEGDLGLRWNARRIVEAARDESLVQDGEADRLDVAAEVRERDPGFVADSPQELGVDVRLAGLAARLALLRHAGRLAITLSAAGASLRHEGRDLRRSTCVVGTGGIFEHGAQPELVHVLEAALAPVEGRLLPTAAPRVVADRRHLLAAAGVLVGEFPDVAAKLLANHLATRGAR